MTSNEAASSLPEEMIVAAAASARDSYAPRSTRRGRRSKEQMDRIRGRIYETAKAYQPLTVRQLFYLLVTRSVVEKTERAYKGTVVRLLTQMREQNLLPFDWIADTTRWMRKPPSYGSLEDALTNTRDFYRRDIWAEQPVYVEVWAESDSVAGIIYEATKQWDVPLMVCRGYPSVTFLHSAADCLNTVGKPAYLYHVGDHDPSGVDIARKNEQRLREWAPNAEIYFECLAVTSDQIKEMDLPSRPTKSTDTRSKGFQGRSVEVESIEPATLREIVLGAIEQHIDETSLQNIRRIEDAERVMLDSIITAMEGDV